MSQENPKLRQTLSFNAINFGTTTTRVFRTPKGMRGRVRLATLLATTSFTGTTTPGKVQVGDVAGVLNKYLDLFAGAAGAGTAASNSATASDLVSGLTNQVNGGPYLYLEPDTQYQITFVAPVGTPAGVADVAITIDYD